MTGLYLGMISGTSVDGVDTVIVRFDSGSQIEIVHAATTRFPEALGSRVRALIESAETSLEALGRLDSALGEFFAECAVAAIRNAGLESSDIEAVGHHGQTVFHFPDGPEPFTQQIGDPNIVAARTGVTTVGDFRRLDLAFGGQGAPLVPAFHEWAFGSDTECRAVVNIGGIANVTMLEPGKETVGFDTGPGNTLLDLWCHRCHQQAYDDRGHWASKGRVDSWLLESLLADDYFARPPPKSTGREHFHGGWLNDHLARMNPPIGDDDVQSTLAELTACTIVRGIQSVAPHRERIVVCGGGARNDDLLVRLRRISGNVVETSEVFGLAPEWVEGAAFAWLARARLHGSAGNVTSVTGARKAIPLGGVYLPSSRSRQERRTVVNDDRKPGTD
jgi:anhydro-N-acetylmuramic acid kinase